MSNQEYTSESNNEKAITTVIVKSKGPLVVISESIHVETEDGKVLKSGVQRVSFCRCGESKNMPYCDGAHKHIQFIG